MHRAVEDGTMKYLSSSPFSVNGTGKVMDGTCLACVFGEGEHSEDCELNQSEPGGGFKPYRPFSPVVST